MEYRMTPDFRFSLDLHLNAVACDIQVNDVPVFRNYSTDRANVDLPVSEFMVPGRNTVTIRVMTDVSEGGMSATLARATLRATPYQGSDWRDLMAVVTGARPAEIGDSSVQAEATLLGPASAQTARFDGQRALLYVTRSVDLKAAIPNWEWLGAPTLDADKSLESLRHWYKWLVGMIVERNSPALREVMHKKAQDLATAFNISSDMALKEIGLAEAVVNPALRLEPINWDALTIELAGNRRLARLYDPREGTVVQFQDVDSELYFGYDFWVCRGARTWEICR